MQDNSCMIASTAVLADPTCREHDTGDGHPESERRFDAVVHALDVAGLTAKMLPVEPRILTREDLLLAHTAEYVALAEHEIRGGSSQLSTGDTTVSPRSWEAALAAAGSALAAVDAVASGKARRAFCAVRPPGHHANSDHGMGLDRKSTRLNSSHG